MMEQLTLTKVSGVHGSVSIPGSKSISNRVLLLAALSDDHTYLEGLLDSDDVSRMKEALITLGINISQDKNGSYRVEGCKEGFANKDADLFLGNAGTAFRPLTAALALSGGHYMLHGVERMHERPIKDLVDALLEIGLSVNYLKKEGYPPLEIFPKKVMTDKLSVDGSVSSQFLTALLLTLPMVGKEMTITVKGTLISKPYISITLDLLKDFGIDIINHDWKAFTVPATDRYRSPGHYTIEGDASSASYFLAMGAIGGSLTVKGVGRKSIQGDIGFADALEKMGAIIEWKDHEITVRRPAHGLTGIDLDCNHIPDAAMTLAVLALFAKGTTTLRNIASWRVKETDRIAAMAAELRKLGAVVEEGPDFISVTPVDNLNEYVTIKTYDDHRMAMCFSLCSFKVPVIILDPQCVDKTFPAYFDYFKSVVTT